MTKLIPIICSLLMLNILSACGQQAAFKVASQLSDNNNQDNSDLGDNNDDSSSPSQKIEILICSKLNFKNVQWEKGLDEFSANAFALAMNISGSYEGHSGWQNIANNFDGQGLSFGLFNQNFGQGSLQPLLINMHNAHPTLLKTIFGATKAKSLIDMLSKWQGSTLSQKAALPVVDSDYSDLDMDEFREDTPQIFQKLSSKNQTSVNWAVKNIYSDSAGKKFVSVWKNAWVKLGGQGEYVTQQVLAADNIHKKALSYLDRFGFNELRAYLFFFDIIVQNGGISSSIESKYRAEIKGKSLSEKEKLKILLKHRLSIVISKYRKDVESRKLAIINGSGTVHGSSRNFPKENCVDNWNMKYDPDLDLGLN